MGQRHRVIRLSDGTIVFDVVGEDSGSEDEDEDEGDDGDDTDGDDDEDDDDESEEESVESLKEKLEAAQAAERKALRRMKSADRAKTAEVKKRQALEDKLNGKSSGSGDDDKSALEQKIADLESKLADAGKPKPEAILKDAFRDYDEVKWHDRNLAFSQLDLSEIPVEEDGTFDQEALADAIKDLQESKPYLVKGAKATDEDDDEDGDPKPRSGAQPKRKPKQSTTDRAVLKQKYKVLESRG